MIYLGIDLGGTKIATGLTDARGNLLESVSIPTDKQRSSDAILSDIVKVSKQLMQSFRLDDVCGAGIGVPGPVDTENGMISRCVNLSWSDVPAGPFLTKELGIPAFVGNDATLAGVAEMEAGALKGVRNGALFTLGTGVGGAVIVDGKILHGCRPISTEFGHMIVGENFYNCNCGNNGCLETFCSATALIAYAKKLLEDGEQSEPLLSLAGGCTDLISGAHIFTAAKEGDPLSLKVTDRLARYAAVGILNIAVAVDPEVVLIGGGLSKAGDFLLDKIRSAFAERTRYFTALSPDHIRLAQFGNEAGIIGAAMLAKQRLAH